MAERPPELASTWEDVVEFSINASAPVEVTELVNHDPSCLLIDRPGDYRVRISASGRTGRDSSEDSDPDSPRPREQYLIEAWPSSPRPPEVVRTAKAADSQERASRPEELAEYEPGLAGALSIGADVDGAPDHRHLSGLAGHIAVRKTITGRAENLFPRLAYGVSWTPGVPSWRYRASFTLELEVPSYASATADHPDQLTGHRGTIRTSIVDVDSPRRITRRWAWLVNDLTTHTSRVVVDDTRVTTSIRSRMLRDGSQVCEVEVVHEGLPIEWLDDMEAWWRLQLTLAEFLGFGKSV